MTYILLYIIWILYSLLEGKKEAHYFSYKMRAVISKKTVVLKVDEHVWFTLQRALVVSLIFFMNFSILHVFFLLLSLALCFPFFHDGMYYVQRKKLDGIYPKGFFDQSTTSTAKMDKLKLLGPASRILGLIASIIIIFALAIAN